MTPSAWTPCLSTGENPVHHQLLHACTHTILEQLARHPAGTPLPPGAMSGYTGALVYLFHLAVWQDDETLYDTALGYLEQLVNGIGSSGEYSLSNGVTGAIWLLGYLDRQDLVQMEADSVDPALIDYLCSMSLQQLESNQYDYMHEGLGIALTLLSIPAYTARYRTYLEKAVSLLAATALQEGDDRIYWRYRTREENGMEISLGLAHGTPSVISILAAMHRQQICPDVCHELMTKAGNYVLAHANGPEQLSCYPSLIRPDDKDPFLNSRLGWCYGDMGVAIAMIHAGHTTGDTRFLQEADRLINAVSLRTDPETAMTADGSFCHGAWGVAHMFNRFYHYKKDISLQRLAIHWFGRSLEMTQHNGQHIAVLQSVDKVSDPYTHRPDLLNGIAGTGLALLAGFAPVAPVWDELFFMNIN